MLGRPALRSLLARSRFLALSAIALGVSLPAVAALCDQLSAVEEEVATLRSQLPGLQADAQAKEQRLANVRSWMPDAEAQQRLAEARMAYEKAKAEDGAKREEYRRVERQRDDVFRQLQDLRFELKNLTEASPDVEKLQDFPEVREFQRRVKEDESFIRSQIGLAPKNATEARAVAGKVADAYHLAWLRAGDLSVFSPSEFEQYKPTSYRGADRSRLWALEQNLSRQVNAYGDQTTRTTRGAEVQSAIRALVEQIRSVRNDTAARLNALASNLESLETAIMRAGEGPATQGRPGYQTGLLSKDERDKRIAELQADINELEETRKRLQEELFVKTRAMADLQEATAELRKAERAVTRTGNEVREADRRDLAEAEQEASQAKALLRQAEERLPIAQQEISHLRRLLNEKAAEISGVIGEARGIPDRAAANVEVGRAAQCDFLRTHHQAELQEALGKFNEEAACLAALGSIPGEIAQITASLQNVSCGTGDEQAPLPDDPFPTTQPDDPQPPPIQTGCGPSAPAGKAYVPAVSSSGLHYQQAMAAVQAAGLRPFAFEHQLAQSPEEDGKVTSQDPAPCTLADLGARVTIFFNTNSVESEPVPDEDTDTSNLIAVPRVQDMHVVHARATIAGANLTPAAFEHGTAPDPQFNGIVTWQRPMPGEMVEPGRTIQIGYNRDFWEGESAIDTPGEDPFAPGPPDEQEPSADPFANPFPGADQELPPPDAAGTTDEASGGGWERSGDLETIEETPLPPADGEGIGPLGQTPVEDAGIEPVDPAVEGLIQQAEAAAARCDFTTALDIGQQIAFTAPDHGWVRNRYPAIQADEQKYQVAKSSLAQARALLQKPEPTQQDVAQASDLARHVQNFAPNCMSQEVSLLNGPIQRAADAARQRDREGMREGIAGLLGALGQVSTALNQGNTSHTGGGDLGGLFGQGGPATSVPSSGSSTSGLSPASSEPMNCNACVVSEATYGTDLVYVFESVYSFSHPSCGSGALRFYEMATFNTDRDDDGRPLNRSEGAENYARQKAATTPGLRVSKLCGPCQSSQQARNLMSSRCPNPNHDLKIGPGGAILNGRRVQ